MDLTVNLKKLLIQKLLLIASPHTRFPQVKERMKEKEQTYPMLLNE